MKKKKRKKYKKKNIDFLNIFLNDNEVNIGDIEKKSYVSLIKFSYKMERLMRKYEIELEERKELSQNLLIIIKDIYRELVV